MKNKKGRTTYTTNDQQAAHHSLFLTHSPPSPLAHFVAQRCKHALCVAVQPKHVIGSWVHVIGSSTLLRTCSNAESLPAMLPRAARSAPGESAVRSRRF